MSEPRTIRFRQAVVIGAALAMFFASGLILDGAAYFDEARALLRGRAGPGGTPDEGEIGLAVAEALGRFGIGGMLGGAPEALPSSTSLAPDQLRGPFPVLSIAADEDYLDDPETGIMANMRETGPEWERLASVSLWEDGVLTVGSRVGLRMHGDSTRYRGDPSFRLHFRPVYGATRESGGRLLGSDAAPARAVVVHVVRWRGHYPNIFVFELARRLELPTVAFRPAKVYLNGQPRGIYVLTERVMPDGWGRTHFGDTDFFMYVYKGETKRPSREAHAELERWVREGAPLTVRTASERIDVANLTAHLFTVMFAFTTDWAQGAALLDRNDRGARWFWLHWDMDQSFDLRGSVELEPWQQPFMELVTLEGSRDDLEAYGIVTDDRHDARHRDDLRRVIFMHLLRDPQYRDYFTRYVTDTLNHRFTPDFLDLLLTRYRDLEYAPGIYNRIDLGAFFRNRGDFVRSEVGRYFGFGEPVTVRVGANDDTRLRIDGFEHMGAYEGRYFRGQQLTLEAPVPSPLAVSSWQVNGQRIETPRLEIVVDRPLTITPNFESRGER